MPNAPIRISSGCEVVPGVVPEFGETLVPVPVVVLPIAGLNWSFGDGETRPLNEKKLTAQLTVVAGEGRAWTVIVPLDNAVVIGAENRSVRTPAPGVVTPFLTSASLV